MYNYTSHHIVLISPISPTSTKHFQTDIHHGEINLIKDSAIFFLYLSRTSITVLQKSARGIYVEESCRPVRHALLLCFESPKNERRTTTNHDRDASLFATIRRPVCGASSTESEHQESAPRSWCQSPMKTVTTLTVTTTISIGDSSTRLKAYSQDTKDPVRLKQ